MNNLPTALFVPPLDENFNADFVPEDGLQYLQQVIYERQKCPEIVTKPISRETPLAAEASSDERSTIDTAANELRPTNEWLRIQSQEFEALQQAIATLLNNCTNTTEPVGLPDIDDPETWLQYCQNNLPLLRTMQNIDQRTLEALLELLNEWLGDELLAPLHLGASQKDSWLGQWIYAALACLQLPLEPAMHSVLRNITRSCYQQRSGLVPSDIENAVPLNLLICVISRNFNQIDLQHRSDVAHEQDA